MTRRNFMHQSALYGALLISSNINASYAASKLHMPEESESHKRTWIAFVADEYIWTKKQIMGVKHDLARLITTIAKYEDVSVLVNPYDYKLLESLLGTSLTKFSIELFECPLDDLWIRDTGPTFVYNNQNEKVGVNFNFNGWGEKQEYAQDSLVADFVTNKARAKILHTQLCLEGGSFEIDGHGTAILTESSVLNDNRNPNMSKKEFERELKKVLGLQKIIWLKGVKGKDITDAHVDFYARFAEECVVVVSREMYKDTYDYAITRENIEILKNATDAKGNKLEVVTIDTPEIIEEKYGVNDFAAGYIGYYVCNGAVIMQKFGDKEADSNAKAILQELFPSRTIEQISIDAIASGGGSIHCATQQEPL